MKTTYQIEANCGDGVCVAQVLGPKGERMRDNPLAAKGSTPILALAALSKTLVDWHNGGSDRRLDEGGMLHG